MNLRCQSSGTIVALDLKSRLGGGGEGVIYSLSDSDNLAAKIYHPGSIDATHVNKLRAMLVNPPADPVRAKGHASIAWPMDLLSKLDGDQAVVGFLMPRLKQAHPISDFYDVTTRHALFPLLSYDYLFRTAVNLASAVRAIHLSGSVIGDVNESNILATDNALVSLVDTDSFQVTDPTDGQVYRCPVGTEMFTPPEIHGRAFTEIDRTTEHDRFGIAVLFFQLLMEGTRPFAGVYRGSEEPPDQVECLLKGYFPFAGHALVDPPPLAPPFQMLHPDLQGLFRRCFVDGHTNPRLRPDAQTWYEVLKASERSLRRCPQNEQHFYFDHYSHCPWCERGSLFTAAGLPDWDPFPPANRAEEFKRYNYAGRTRPGSWRPVSSSPGPGARPRPQPSPPPGQSPSAPAFFRASVAAITLGQPVTLQWSIPNASNIRIANSAGRRVFTGHAGNGTVTLYPTKSETYHINAQSTGTTRLRSLTVSVQPVSEPVLLKEVSLELNQPALLKAMQLRLREGLSLREIAIRLLQPLELKRYLPLRAFGALNQITVNLKQRLPFNEVT